jgi:hypothetical protein
LLKGPPPSVAIKQYKEIDFHDVCAGPVLGSENRADRGDKLQAGDSTVSFSFLAVWMHISVLLWGPFLGSHSGHNFGSAITFVMRGTISGPYYDPKIGVAKIRIFRIKFASRAAVVVATVTGLRLVPLICCVQRARFRAPKVAYFSMRLERSPLLLPPLLLLMLLQ